MTWIPGAQSCGKRIVPRALDVDVDETVHLEKLDESSVCEDADMLPADRKVLSMAEI